MFTAEYCMKHHRLCDPSKDDENSKIWTITDLDARGVHLFTFDKKKFFSFWEDYPDNLTPEQKAIFDKEYPILASMKDKTVPLPPGSDDDFDLLD